MRKTILLLFATLVCSIAFSQSANDYIDAAKRGDKRAQNNLGICYLEGWGCKQNHEQAFYWFAKAAEQGVENSQFNMGVYYLTGEYAPADTSRAIFWFTKAAEQGNIAAQECLGDIYREKKDYKRSFQWFLKAAKQGSAYGAYRVALDYMSGHGVVANLDKAEYWGKKAEAKKESLDKTNQNLLELFWVLLKNQRKWEVEKAAENGDAEAQYQLGERYRLGDDTRKNDSLAAEWYTKAAEQGHTYAQYRLASYFYDGIGMPKDKRQAKYWARKVKGRTWVLNRNEFRKYETMIGWPYFYHDIDGGLQFSYIQRALKGTNLSTNETEYYDMYGFPGWTSGFQIGFHFNPTFEWGLGLQWGIYYEMLFEKWKDAPEYYYNKYMEINLYAPVDLAFRIPFDRENALYLRAGLGFDFSCYGHQTYSEDSNIEPLENEYGNAFIDRFNVSFECGASIRLQDVILHFSYQFGKTNHPVESGYKVNEDKVSCGLSFVL